MKGVEIDDACLHNGSVGVGGADGQHREGDILEELLHSCRRDIIVDGVAAVQHGCHERRLIDDGVEARDGVEVRCSEIAGERENERVFEGSEILSQK